MACHPRTSMSCYPRIRLQSSRRWDARGGEDQRTRETEAREDPTDSDQPVQSHPSTIRRGQIMGVEGSERSDWTQPTTNRQSGKAHQTETEQTGHPQLPQHATADLVPSARSSKRHGTPSCHDAPPPPLLPLPAHHLPTTFVPSYPRCPRCYPSTERRSPTNSQAVLRTLTWPSTIPRKPILVRTMLSPQPATPLVSPRAYHPPTCPPSESMNRDRITRSPSVKFRGIAIDP